MKKHLLFFTAIFLVTVVLFNVTADTTSLKSRSDLSITIDQDRIKNDIHQLTSTSDFRNYKNIAALNEAASYIYSEFKKIGFHPKEQPYELGGETYKNILAYYGPSEGKRIVIGAHYDVCGDQVGADDNASGVAGLLELARQFKKHKPNTSYRFEFVAYTLEEPPFFRTEYMGSHIHAKDLFENKTPVEAMISLEMIGYFSEEPNSQDYPIGIMKYLYPTTGNYIAVVGKLGQGRLANKIKKGMTKGSSIDVCSINGPARMSGIDFSDHLNYWKYSFDAVMITDTSFYRNSNYHKTSDRPETLNYVKMAAVIQGLACALFNYE